MTIIPSGTNREAAAQAAARYGDVGGLCITLGPDGMVKFGAENLTFEQIQMCLRTATKYYGDMARETERQRKRERDEDDRREEA